MWIHCTREVHICVMIDRNRRFMRELKLESITPLEHIQNQLWTIVDALRDSVSLNDSYVILLFISLHKDGLISKKFLSEYDNKSFIISKDSCSDQEKKLLSNYTPIINSFDQTLRSINSKNIIQIVEILFEINHELLDNNFSDIFDTFLYKISESQGRIGSAVVQPIELSRLVHSLSKINETDKIFNPFAGFASYGVFFDGGNEYTGQELDTFTWAVGALRIMAHQRSEVSNFQNTDSISNWPLKNKYDLVVASPPFGKRLSKDIGESYPGIRTIEHFLLKKGIESITDNGKVITVLAQGILFRGGSEKRLREELIENDLIETIILLPAGILQNTGMSIIILVINKQKAQPGKVQFINATKFVHLKGTRKKILNDYALNSVIIRNNKNLEHSRLVDISVIKENDYNLNVQRYFQKEIEGVKLGTILNYYRGRSRDIPIFGKILRFSNLINNDNIEVKLDLDRVETTDNLHKYSRLLDESCIIISSFIKSIKPTWFEYSGIPVFIRSDMMAFRIDENNVDYSYLINELRTDYVKEQLESYGIGTSMHRIKRDDLLNIVIKLPSLEEQKAKVKGLKQYSEEIESLRNERNALVHGTASAKYNEFASLKHTLGRPRQNILDWNDNLLHFFTENPKGFETLNSSFLEYYGSDIISVLKEMKRDINFMTDVLEKGENGFVIEEYKNTIISLIELNKIVQELSSNGFKFKIKKLLFKGYQAKRRGIEGNEILLKTLFDNLLTNANKYGFDKKMMGNEVIIEITEAKEDLVIEFRNNGKPFPKNYDRSKFITKYSTADSNSGTGLGGYDIHRIASAFQNPDWELILNTDPIFPVIFKFQFPIILIN